LRFSVLFSFGPAHLLQHGAHDRFRRALRVDLGVVEEIDACVKGRRHAFAGEIVAELVAVGHPRPEGELTDPEARAAQAAVVHVVIAMLTKRKGVRGSGIVANQSARADPFVF